MDREILEPVRLRAVVLRNSCDPNPSRRENDEVVFTVLSLDSRESFATRDINAAADKLRHIYGVEDPVRILQNAAKWGMIEVVDYPRR